MAKLFDYEKPGRGIEKDAPKKRSFFLFFQYYFANIWRFMLMSMVYCLISVPIVTNGLANAGFTNVARNIARDKHSFGLSDFFETIKKNWKQGLVCGIINTVVYALLFFNAWYFFSLDSGYIRSIGLGAMIFCYITFTIMNFYIWTLMITFNYKISQLYKNAFRFTFISAWRNLLCLLLVNLVIIASLSILLVNMYWALTVVIFPLFCCLPAFIHLMIQFFVFPVIKKYAIDPYYRNHPDEDIELRQDLGLEIEYEDEEVEEEAESDTSTDQEDTEEDNTIFND